MNFVILAFHQILHFSDPCIFHISMQAVSFLFQGYALQHASCEANSTFVVYPCNWIKVSGPSPIVSLDILLECLCMFLQPIAVARLHREILTNFRMPKTHSVFKHYKKLKIIFKPLESNLVSCFSVFY